VLFARTTDRVQWLQVARRELALKSAIAKLDRYDLLIVDDLAYVTKDQAETSVLFELIAARYERRSMRPTRHDARGHGSPRAPRHDPGDECRKLSTEEALDRKRGRGRPPTHATIKKTDEAEH
jgi:hypothetical protein